MVCFVPIVCLSIRKSSQRRDCSDLGTVRNWVDHCMIATPLQLFRESCLFVTSFSVEIVSAS